MKNKITKIKDNLKKTEKFLFKTHNCICCGRECDLDNNYRICSHCLESLDFTGDHYCLSCGEKISEDYDYCLKCKDDLYDFDYARNIFIYDDIISTAIMNFKYNGKLDYSLPLGTLLKDYYSNSDIIADVVTFVPMPKDREKKRGYNQAKELAKVFSSLTEITMEEMLERVEPAIKQSVLTAKERRENIKGTITAINKHKIKNKDILIIDDVLTTGATASECAKILKKSGARSVCVLTIAKTNLNNK